MGLLGRGHDRMSSPELDSLLAVLDQCGAREFTLFIDNSLIQLLSALAPYSVLTQHGVHNLVPLVEEQNTVKSHSDSVFLTTSNPKAISLVSKTISQITQAGRLIPVIVVPELSPSVSLLFTKYGVLGDIELKTWSVGLVPDPAVPDLLSCYLPSARDQQSGVWPLAWALDNLQATSTGLFGKTTAVGPKGRDVLRILGNLRAEHAVKQQNLDTSDHFDYHFGYSSSLFTGSEIEHAVIIDRDLDLITPLLMQTTYAGVLAETVGISASGTTGSKMSGNKFSLRNDEQFAELAELPFSDACQEIHKSAKHLQTLFQAGSSELERRDASVSDYRNVVQKLTPLESSKKKLHTHTELASIAMTELDSSFRREVYDLQSQMLENRIANTQAIARIQDLVFQMSSLPWVLRLIALLALLRGGIKEQVLQNLFNGDICRTYGYEHLDDIETLNERGLIFSPKGSSFLLSTPSFASFVGGSAPVTSQNSNTAGDSQRAADTFPNLIDTTLSQHYTWNALNKAYKLYPSDDPESKQYSGYTPLTARIAQLALGQMPLQRTPLEPEFEVVQNSSKDLESWREAKLRRTLARNSTISPQPVVLVVIVGGVTYAEVSAIQAACASSHRRVVVASSHIITGESIV